MKNKKVMLFTIVVIAVFIVSLLGCTEMVDSNYEKPQEIDNIFVEDSVIYKYRNSAVDPADDYDDYHAQMTIDHRIEYEDGMIALNYNGESVLCYGVDDGPFNGFDPYIATNAFSMEEEKDYFIYIDDLLGQDYSSELYIDLKKVEVK